MMTLTNLRAWTLLSVGLAGWTLAGCHRGSPAPAPGELRLAAAGVLAEVLESQPAAPSDPTMTEQARRDALLAQFQLQAQALEVLAEHPQLIKPAWLDAALDSQSDAVRYSALLTIGRIHAYRNGQFSQPYVGRVRKLLGDPNVYIRLASAYALYRLTGQADQAQTVAALATHRLEADASDKRPERLRAEAVYVISLMPELSPEPLLTMVAEKDSDAGVQTSAVTALARLGDAKAVDRVVNIAQSPSAEDQLDALGALGQCRLDDLGPLQRLLKEDRQEEIRMAAARALAMHGDTSGLTLALAWLDFRDPEPLRPTDLRKDPLHEYRVRILAALAVGAAADYDGSAGPLLEAIRHSPSKRFQLAAARAALELLVRSGRWSESGSAGG